MNRTDQIHLLPSFPGVFSADELGWLLRELALRRELEALLSVYTGQVLRSSGLEVFENDAGPGVRLGEIVFVADGQIVRAGPLMTPVARPARHVYLDWAVTEAPLEQPAHHVTITGVRASLHTETSAGSPQRLEVARLHWRADRPSIDPGWWPEVTRIGADPRSLAMAKKLLPLLPESDPARQWFASQLATCEWATFMPWLLRAIQTRAPLGQRALEKIHTQDSSVAAFAEALLSWTGAHGNLPSEFEGCALLGGIRPENVRTQGRRTIYRFAASSLDELEPRDRNAARDEFRLAILAQTDGKLGRAELHTHGGAFERPVTNHAPAMIGVVTPGNSFELALDQAELMHAGLYAPQRAVQA
jgi:hypothetical protein